MAEGQAPAGRGGLLGVSLAPAGLGHAKDDGWIQIDQSIAQRRGNPGRFAGHIHNQAARQRPRSPG
jgi:hypothetical protein